jgi:hypothetical protein
MGFTISATVTAKTGPAKQVTTEVIRGITAITIDTKREVIQLYQGAELTGPCREFDLHGVTTITDTIANGNHTVVIS